MLVKARYLALFLLLVLLLTPIARSVLGQSRVSRQIELSESLMTDLPATRWHR